VNAIELSVVIPVYRSAPTLKQLVQRLLPTLAATGMTHEVVFIDDGSADNSWEVLADLQAAHPNIITAIRLMRNYGQHNALMCGFRHARGQYVVTIDDDLQNPPEEIHKLLRALQDKQLDLVYGYSPSKQHQRWRNLGSFVIQTFYQSVFKTSVRTTSFRAIRREALQGIFSYDLNFTYIDGLLAWNTQRIGEVEVVHAPREHGSSGYSIRHLLRLALNLFTNFSLLPLQLVSLCGLLTAATGFLTGGYYLVQSIFSGIAVPGYASTIIAILLLGGVQLLALGIMGEYLGRLHLNVNRKPQYTERVVHRAGEQPAPEAPPNASDADAPGAIGGAT